MLPTANSKLNSLHCTRVQTRLHFGWLVANPTSKSRCQWKLNVQLLMSKGVSMHTFKRQQNDTASRFRDTSLGIIRCNHYHLSTTSTIGHQLPMFHSSEDWCGEYIFVSLQNEKFTLEKFLGYTYFLCCPATWLGCIGYTMSFQQLLVLRYTTSETDVHLLVVLPPLQAPHLRMGVSNNGCCWPHMGATMSATFEGDWPSLALLPLTLL